MTDPRFVRQLYRRMLKIAGGMRNDTKRNEALKSIRNGFRTNQTESNSDLVKIMIEKAEKSISYMKMVGTKTSETNKEPITRMMMINGELKNVNTLTDEGIFILSIYYHCLF